MTDASRTRGNPLLRQVSAYQSLDEIAAALSFSSLPQGVRSQTILQRHKVLMGEKTVITSTATLLRTALTIMGMHRSSLEARNPYEPVNRAWVMKMIESAQRGVLYTGGAPAPGACALVVKGITGTRKSITVKRVLKMLGPQVIHHGPDDDARWKQAMNRPGNPGGSVV